MNADPAPLAEGCDPFTCAHRLGGEHSDDCIPALAEVWCANCDKPAVRSFEVTNGSTTYTTSKCADHGWVLIAPTGGSK
jgi:hypothetical protein